MLGRPKGVRHVDRLIARVEDPAEALPLAARAILMVLVSTLRTLDQQIAVLDAEIASRARHDPVARDLNIIPGDRPNPGDSPNRTRSLSRSLQERSPLRCPAGPHAETAIDRRPTEARRDHQGGRANTATAPDHRGQRRHRTGLHPRRAGRVMARPDCWRESRRCWSSSPWPTRTPASSRRYGPKAMSTELRACRPSQHQRETSKRRMSEGAYGATVGETGSGKPGLSTVPRARFG